MNDQETIAAMLQAFPADPGNPYIPGRDEPKALAMLNEDALLDGKPYRRMCLSIRQGHTSIVVKFTRDEALSFVRQFLATAEQLPTDAGLHVAANGGLIIPPGVQP